MLKKILTKLHSYVNRRHLNYYKTFYINYMLLNWKDAMRFPILIYGDCHIDELEGTVEFMHPITKGMLIIGEMDPVRSFYSKSFIKICGKLKIGKNVVLRKGIKLNVKNTGVLELEVNVYVGNNITIITFGRTTIGAATRIGNNTTFMDTDFHYIINTETRTVRPNISTIKIGSNCWIGGNCTIKKGTNLPKGTILAGPYSMVGKDYTDKIPEFSIIGGSPAKLLVEHQRRINNDKVQSMLSKYFEYNKVPYAFDESINLDELCMPLD